MKQLLFIILLVLAQQITAQQDPYLKIKEKEETFAKLPVNEIKPTGWLANQLRFDLDGFVGHLDTICPGLIINHDIYGKDRITKGVRRANSKDADSAESLLFLWWDSETQSNWRDGYIRTAFLLNDKQHIEKIKAYVSHILATQDEDGYLGIYAPDLRYNFNKKNGENGELWAKATLFRGLLAYYGFTKDKAVLKAVERGVQNVMDNYQINACEPFNLDNPEDGITHGLNFTDVLDQLYYLTHDIRYWDYALFLYKDYSIHMDRNGDIRYQNILDPQYLLWGHAAHTFEHFRPLLVASYASGNPQLQEAVSIYLERMKYVSTVSGGPVGDEWIKGRKADPTYIGYEYCTMFEKLDSYTQFVQ
ncbi:MAG: glycoside hydrolase family 127 protein, partial [Mediterranea sp.]|nr:glycoside hydrolase family 127 protein [Mediterranea sp.]